MAPDPSSVVARQVEAYNAHDLEAFLACYAPDATIRVEDDVALRGHDDLRAAYADAFAARRQHAVIVQRLAAGAWVVDEERATGTRRGDIHVLVAYRVSGAGLIDRVVFLG